MKKILASVGAVALGTVGLQAENAPGLSRMEASKPWSISAALRGFYDDNYTTSPKGFEPDSFGIELPITLALNFPMDTTYVGVSYTYSMRYYEDRDSDPVDNQHEFLLKVDHRFSERYSIYFEDSMAYSQEPDVVDPNFSSPLRTESNAFRNYARLRFRAEITETAGIEAAYQNGYFFYDDEGAGSRSAVLDRIEHLFRIDGRYRAQPNLVGLVGYNLGLVDYNGDDPISPFFPGVDGSIRNSTSHYGYVGAEYAASRQLAGTLRVGAQYTDYTELNDDTLSPYVELAGSYTYSPGSYIQFGVRHSRIPTDVTVLTAADTDITVDQESTMVFASLNHRITSRLTGRLLGHFQHGRFNGGTADGDVDNLILFGANLEYKFTQNWGVEGGYNWDRLDSDIVQGGIPRSYSRNRVYLGVRASF